jgi:SAM-dependent methyltransferase
MTPHPPQDPSSALTARYDEEAAAYVRYWSPVLQVPCRSLVEALPIAASTVLDIGTGAGAALPLLATRYPQARIVGIDRSLGMASLSAHPKPVAVADALYLPFVDDTFEVAVMAFMLFHLPDIDAGLREPLRVLQPGGMLALSTWFSDVESPAVAMWNDALDNSNALSADDIPRLARHDLMDTPEKLVTLLGDSGFVECDATTRPFAYPITADHFSALRTRVGACGQRFRSLHPDEQSKFLATINDRFIALSDDDFTLHMKTNIVTARAPR